MKLRVRHSFLALLLLLSTGASATTPQSEIDCVGKAVEQVAAPEEITTPEIELTPDKAPAWSYRTFKNYDNATLERGQANYSFRAETISGEHGEEVVEVSNERFKNAPGWGQLQEWLLERLAIARDYADRSRYWITRPWTDKNIKKPLRKSKVETTYGMTWSEYTREDIEGKSPEEIYGNPKLRLPEEKTLQLPVKRYFDSTGKGIAIEFRAVSKDPHTTPNWLRDEGLNQMIVGIIDAVKKYPELYDKPIVTCYADELHRGLYEHWMKMKVQTETTPLDKPAFIHDKNGQPDRRVAWHYIEVSPRDLEKVLIERSRGARTLLGLNLPYPFKLPDGREVMAAPKARISFDLNENVTQATLEKPTELENGIIAEKGATAFWADRHLVRVSAIQGPYPLDLKNAKVVAPSGATLEWDHPLLLEWRGEHPRPQERGYFLQPDFDSDPLENTMTGTHELYKKMSEETERLGIQDKNSEEFKRRLLDIRGSSIQPKITRVVGSSEHPVLLPELGIQATEVAEQWNGLRVRLAKDYVTDDGLKAAAGSDLVPSRQGDKWVWNRIALSEDCVLNGIPFKKGTLLVVRFQDDTGTYIRAYDDESYKKFKSYHIK